MCSSRAVGTHRSLGLDFNVNLNGKCHYQAVNCLVHGIHQWEVSLPGSKLPSGWHSPIGSVIARQYIA